MMRIAMCVLADAANVRDGLLSVLSAGINMTQRSEYPSPLNVHLALLLELDDQDLQRSSSVELSVRVLDSQGEEIRSISGSAKWEAQSEWPMYIPAPVPLDRCQIPAPGRYDVRVKVGDLDEDVIPFYATLLAADN